jgi:hypothetical protein
LKDLQGNENQRGIETEGRDKVAKPLFIREEEQAFAEAVVDIPVIVEQKANSQKKKTVSEQPFPDSSLFFHVGLTLG